MRIRTIKPEFWASEGLHGLDDFAMLLAIGLLNYADDEGYFNANPALIRASLFPLREDYGSITVALQHLSKRNYLRLFSGEGGRVFGKVENFQKHQVINKPNESKIKGLCVSEILLPEHYRSTTVALPSGTGNREQGTGNREKEGKGVQGETESAGVEFSLSLNSPSSSVQKKQSLTDSDWLDCLSASPAYAGIDVKREHAKMVEWCNLKRKQATRNRFLNWLNRVEKPMQANARHALPECIQDAF
jgi:hypothetical protein